MSKSKESKYHVSPEELEREKSIIESAIVDPGKFALLYKRYHEDIFRFIYQRLDDKSLAFDTTSQVFLKAMLNISKYEFRGIPFSSWLYRIAINELKQIFKKNLGQRTINIESMDAELIIDQTGGNIEHPKGLIEALCNLAEEELYLVEMRFFEQMAFKEIAEILNLTENNAKVRLYRVLDKLKKIMTQQNNETV